MLEQPDSGGDRHESVEPGEMDGDEGAHAAAPPVVKAWVRTLEEALSGLRDNTVTHVYLHNKGIGDAEAVAIGAGLKHNTSLQHLILDSNQIGDEGAKAIGAALEHNTSLQRLNLGSNQIGADGTAAIGVGLEHNASLQHLYLYNSQIGDDEAVSIGAALGHTTSLQYLNLCYNNIGSEGAKAIGAGLKHNISLRHLDIRDNEIGDGGAQAIGAALKLNTSLQRLDLNLCDKHASFQTAIGDTGAAAIFAGLEQNTTLNRLELTHHPIRSLGTEFLWTRRLEECWMSFSKLDWPPPSIVSRGHDAIYAFLLAVEERHAPLARSRVMFVGVGGSGKTTLKTALLLRGAGTLKTLHELRRSLKETIKLQWTEAALEEWVDNHLAHEDGFFSSCPSVRGLTGEVWLQMSSTKVSEVFGHPGTFTSEKVVTQMKTVLQFLNSNHDDAAANDEVPYGKLLNIPHVWTEGVELDTRWEEYTLWDFPGQMELYPSHRLFLACETAVYVLVVNGWTGEVAECMRQLRRWLSLIRSGMRGGGCKVVARIVVTHTDSLAKVHRDALLRDVHDALLPDYANHFDFGGRCYATVYANEDGGNVDALRAELSRLRSVLPPNRPLPASYQAICDDVLALARENSRWPVVPASAIDWRGQAEAPLCLEELGFLRLADDQIILEPVTWLSTLMTAFLHPLHGILSLTGARRAVTLPTGATAAAKRKHHIESVHVDAATACQIVSLRKKLVDPEHASEVLPLLAQFDICFSPLDDGKYVFPSLLPKVISLPPWLERLFEAEIEGRRYLCIGDYDFIPPTVASLMMQRVVSMGRRLGGKPLFFGRGTVVVGLPDRSVLGVCVCDDERAFDVFACGSNRIAYVSGIAVHLVAVLSKSYQGLRVAKYRLSRLRDEARDDAFVDHPCEHPLFGSCEALPIKTQMRDDPSAGGLPERRPEWLTDEYELALPLIPFWVAGSSKRLDYFRSYFNSYIKFLVDPSLVEETWPGMDTTPRTGSAAAVSVSAAVEMERPDDGKFETSVEHSDDYAGGEGGAVRGRQESGKARRRRQLQKHEPPTRKVEREAEACAPAQFSFNYTAIFVATLLCMLALGVAWALG